MHRRIAHLVVIPLLLAAVGFGGRMVMEHSWDELVDYESPYSAPLVPGPMGEALTEQVVIILQDGLRLDTSGELEKWNQLRAQGASVMVKAGQPSLSIPSFTVINTGAYQEVSGVTTNWYAGAMPPVDSIYCEAQRKGLTTAMVQEAGGPKLFARCLDSPVYPEMPDDRSLADDVILEESLAILQEKPNLLWVHFSGSDWAGHHHGGSSEQYEEMAREIDGRVARIVEAVDLDSAVLVLVSDHGHIDSGGHGGWEEVVVQTPLVIAGKGIRPGSYGLTDQANIAPTVAVLLGLAIPTHSQGEPMYELLDVPLELKAERAVEVARQLQGFYSQYVAEIGSADYRDDQLAEAEQALGRGDYEGAYKTAREYAAALRSHAEEMKSSRMWRERLGRAPIAAVVAAVVAAYLVLYSRRRELLVPLLGAGIYFLAYDGYFFARGMRWSLSVFNEESLIPAFLTGRLLEAVLSLTIAVVVVGVLMRGRTASDVARAGVNTSVLVAMGLLLQVILYYWLYGLDIEWAMPNLRLGFKYYLDLLQLFAIGVAGLAAPLVAVGSKAVSERVAALPGPK